MQGPPERQYALIIPDGAGDRLRIDGRSPLAIARTDAMDAVARAGVSGRMRTLHPGLPHGSLVAHLGMLGWDPHRFHPLGRSSCELLALDDVELEAGDLSFRANLVRMKGNVLTSYCADSITSEVAAPLVERLDRELRREYPDFELYHNLDFRNSLVVRKPGVDPRRLRCVEPHEHQGRELDRRRLIKGDGAAAKLLARRLNRYLLRAAELLDGTPADMLIPWSPAEPLRLTPFAANVAVGGRAGIVAAMDFLHGVAKAGGMSFHKHGNGRVDTDFREKGTRTVELLEDGCRFVVCHVNAPDEAAHMGDVKAKIRCIEEVDRHVVAPVLAYFRRHPERLGGLAVLPDHFTNVEAASNNGSRRMEAHSLDPVPFTILGRHTTPDAVERYSEDDAVRGRYGDGRLSHLDLLRLLGMTKEETKDAL